MTAFAFLAFLFSYALQVVTGREAFGLLPYLLLVPGACAYLLTIATPALRRQRLGFDAIDAFVAVFLSMSAIHIVLGIAFGGYGFIDAVRLAVIFVGSGWIYFYVSRVASKRSIRAIMIAIAVSTVMIALQWTAETYMKMVLKEIPTFQRLSYEYQKRRMNLTDEEMNPSALGTQYRAHGLEGSHPLTGTVVGIGSFAVLAALPRLRRRTKMLILAFFFAVLLVGFATTALLAYILLFPFVLWLHSRRANVAKIVWRIAQYALVAGFGVLVIASATAAGRRMLENTWILFKQQAFYLFGLDATMTTTFAPVYGAVFVNYANFLVQKPLAMALGEGPVGYGSVVFQRGGDVGLLDLASGYGVPFTIAFFVMCFVAVFRGVRAVRARGVLDESQGGFTIFACATVLFLMVSFVHYAVFFNKTVLVLFYLALGLLRRYGVPRTVREPARAATPGPRALAFRCGSFS